jgi:DNA replication protein DnaD
MPENPEQEKTPTAKKIEDVMTAEERHATGLSNLSPVELQKLNAWLETNVGKLGLSVAKQAPGPISN